MHHLSFELMHHPWHCINQQNMSNFKIITAEETHLHHPIPKLYDMALFILNMYISVNRVLPYFIMRNGILLIPSSILYISLQLK